MASSSSVSLNCSTSPENTAILPPGMQNALTWVEPTRLTSHCQCAASGFQRGACGVSRWTMARMRIRSGTLSGASAPSLAALSITCLYSACARRSISSEGITSRMLGDVVMGASSFTPSAGTGSGASVARAHPA